MSPIIDFIECYGNHYMLPSATQFLVHKRVHVHVATHVFTVFIVEDIFAKWSTSISQCVGLIYVILNMFSDNLVRQGSVYPIWSHRL